MKKNLVTLSSSLVMGCSLASSVSAMSSEQPNIVVFLADDLGWGDTHCYGNEKMITPNIDKLASQGVRFTQCYAACGVCSPSRSAILTGRTPYRNGVWRHLSGNGPTYLRTSEITYPKLLSDAGYETCHVGKWHLNSRQMFNNPEYPQPDAYGYDYWMCTHNNAIPSHKNPNNFVRNGKPVGVLEGYSALLVEKECIHWLDDVRDPSKPFALSVWVHEPHQPVATAPQFVKQYKNDRNAKYMGNITQLDFALGQLMDALETRGLSENTLLIFTSDNGPEGRGGATGGSTGGLRGRKRDDYEGGIRVPGIVRWPGHIKPGTVSDVPVIGSDIFATVLDVCGIPLPTDRVIDGVSMLPAFAGQPVERTIPLFWRTHVSGPDDRVAMRIGDWKLVGDETLTKFQLFNIQKDWKEEDNLAAAMPEKTTEMKRILLDLWADIEAEGPREWWENDKQHPKKGGKLSY